MSTKIKNLFLLSLLLFLICLISCDTKSKDVKKESDIKKESVGLFLIEQNKKYGYINKKGDIVINPQFDHAEGFSEGLAAVNMGGEEKKKYSVEVVEGGKWGYIDQTGRYVIKPQFDNASSFSDGLAQVAIIGDIIGGVVLYKDGYIDKTGKYVINPQFYFAGDFSEGLASAAEDFIIQNKFGYIDKTGKYVIKPQFSFAGNFSEGLAVVEVDGKYGYIDKTGKYVINPQFSFALIFLEDLAPVELDHKWGYIDKTGKYVIKPQFDSAGYFSGGLAPVKAKVDDKYGYIDKTGKYVINPQFDNVRDFSEGLAAVGIGEISCRWGYIDKNGKMVINPQFDDASSFEEGMAHVKIGDKEGYIDKSGKYVWKGAKSKQIEEEKNRSATVIKKMRKIYDDVREVTFYIDKTTPFIRRANSVHLYIADAKITPILLHFVVQYAREGNWLFVESYIFKIDGKTYHYAPRKVERDTSTKYDNYLPPELWVLEWSDGVVDENIYEIVNAIINSKSAKIRVEGQQYYKDRIITSREKQALKNVLDAYEAMGGSFNFR